MSLIQSDVDLGTSDGCETSSERPLEGQSPYVANVQLGYDSEPLGLNLALLYNVFGKRIVEVGTSSLPDVYEQPRHLLDFVVGVKLGAGFALKFKAKNLIDLPVDRKAGDLIQARYVAGRSFGLG